MLDRWVVPGGEANRRYRARFTLRIGQTPCGLASLCCLRSRDFIVVDSSSWFLHRYPGITGDTSSSHDMRIHAFGAASPHAWTSTSASDASSGASSRASGCASGASGALGGASGCASGASGALGGASGCASDSASGHPASGASVNGHVGVFGHESVLHQGRITAAIVACDESPIRYVR